MKYKIATLGLAAMSLAGCVEPAKINPGYKPGQSLAGTKNGKELVDALNDSTLNANIAKYNEYYSDFDAARSYASYINNGSDGVFINPAFDKKPKMNESEYALFLARFEVDSIETLYTKLYQDSIIPKLIKQKIDSVKVQGW